MSRENVEIVRALQPQPEWDLVTLLGDEATAAAMTDGFAPHLHDDFETLAVGLQMTAEVSIVGTAMWTVHDGKIARARFYAHRDEALEAVGLRE